MKKLFFALLLSAAMVFTLTPLTAFAAPDEGGDPAVTVTQTKLNDRGITVNVPGLDAMVASGTADEIALDAAMTYGEKVTSETKVTKKLAEIDAASKSFTAELPFYGKYQVQATFLKGGSPVGEPVKLTVGVAAEEYNIALPVATTDPLIFSLKYFIDGAIRTANDSGEEIPTIVTLNRYAQYDWDNLPAGMYRNPLLTAEENSSAMSWDSVQGANNRVDRVQQYVKELNEIHAGSKFNFYINDYHIYSFPKISYANGLADGQYTLTLITDGSGTYTCFNESYGNEADAQAKHDALVAEYNEFKAKAGAGEVTDYNNLPSGLIRNYAYAIVEAENAQWWVVRRSADTFGIQDQTFQAKVLGDARISNNYINGLLSNVQNAGKDEAFKALYKFDDEAFNATRAKGKKIMMILGTSKSLEDKYVVTDYVRFMVATMGDEYEFYYKGHPGNYMANSEANVKKFADMGIQMLDPSIAAELFLFYNDDIYLCGYESSLYNNVSGEKSEIQDVALFRRTMETAKADFNLAGYADYMDFFISDLTDDTDNFTYAYDETWDAAREGMKEAKDQANALRTKALALIPASEAGAKVYLVQFNNSEKKTVSEHDYALWDSDNSTIHYVDADAEGNLSIVETVNAANNLNDMKVSVTGLVSKTYTGSPLAQKVTVTADGKQLAEGKDYTLGYQNNVKIGKATMQIIGIGEYSGQITKSFKIIPKGTTMTFLKKGKKSFTARWKKGSSITGYQITYSRSKSFKSAKTVTVKKSTVLKTTVKKLKAKKYYYVKVRTYKSVNGTKYYSAWSKPLKVKTR